VSPSLRVYIFVVIDMKRVIETAEQNNDNGNQPLRRKEAQLCVRGLCWRQALLELYCRKAHTGDRSNRLERDKGK
jgi:hypothetical protein